MFRVINGHGIKLCNCQGSTMIDWNKYDAWKLDAPEQDESPKCVYVRCNNEPKKGEDYCSQCISQYECHECDQILPKESNWHELRSSYFVCSKCYEKITG